MQDMIEKDDTSETEEINVLEPEESEPSQTDDVSATSSNITTSFCGNGSIINIQRNF